MTSSYSIGKTNANCWNSKKRAQTSRPKIPAKQKRCWILLSCLFVCWLFIFNVFFRLLFCVLTSAVFFLHIQKELTRCHYDALLITLQEAHAKKEVLFFLHLTHCFECSESAKPWPFYFLGSCLVLGLVLSWVLSCHGYCLVLSLVLSWVLSRFGSCIVLGLVLSLMSSIV